MSGPKGESEADTRSETVAVSLTAIRDKARQYIVMPGEQLPGVIDKRQPEQTSETVAMTDLYVAQMINADDTLTRISVEAGYSADRPILTVRKGIGRTDDAALPADARLQEGVVYFIYMSSGVIERWDIVPDEGGPTASIAVRAPIDPNGPNELWRDEVTTALKQLETPEYVQVT